MYDWSKMNGENPYAAPARIAATRRVNKRDAARYAHQALSATPSVTATLNDATGPSNNVTGESSSAGSGIHVFHMRLTPLGSIRLVVNSGFWWVASA